MIELFNVSVFYGKIQVLKQVSLSVAKSEIVALVGSNGAGKSTLVKAIAGLLPKKSGEVCFDGRAITALPPEKIVQLGIAVVPEGRRLFGPLSVVDNLNLGGYLRLKDGKQEEVQKDLQAVFELFPRIKERSKQPAGTLSGGEQQMLVIARALMARPKAILMDEPSIGLAPLIVQEIFKAIRRLQEEGNTILLIEQNAHMALKVSHRAYLMELGCVTGGGDVKDLLENNDVKKLYLGS